MSNNQPNLQQLREDIRQLTNNIISILNDYNRNIESYNSNLNNALTNIIRLQTTLINTELQNINSRQNRYSNTERETANSLLNLFLNGRPLAGTRYTTFSNNNRRTVSRNLTQEQINSLTEIISYNQNMTEVRCPITWEEFTIGENITRIRNCGHIFKTASLNNWLRNNNVCPVCRQNILNYNNQARPISVETSQNTNSIIETNEESSSDDEDNQNEIIVDMEINSNGRSIENMINSILRDMTGFSSRQQQIRDFSGNYI